MAVESKTKLNLTSLFLLPIYGIYHQVKKVGFVNAYLSDVNREPINNTDIHLYLLFHPDPEQMIELEDIREKLEAIDNSPLLEDYDYEDGYVVLVLKFPEQFRDDYNKFLLGKYSKFSHEFKNKLPRETVVDLHGEKIPGKSFQLMVCDKDKRLIKNFKDKMDLDISEAEEYWSIYDEKLNNLNINDFIC